jgi:hypothetical protein
MNLWIRSQDKKKLVNINAVNILEFEALIAIHGYINSETHFWLGNYKTKERALEVLDEIQNKIKEMYILENCELQKNSCYEQSLAMTDFNIYQMPEK